MSNIGEAAPRGATEHRSCADRLSDAAKALGVDALLPTEPLLEPGGLPRPLRCTQIPAEAPKATDAERGHLAADLDPVALATRLVDEGERQGLSSAEALGRALALRPELGRELERWHLDAVLKLEDVFKPYREASDDPRAWATLRRAAKRARAESDPDLGEVLEAANALGLAGIARDLATAEGDGNLSKVHRLLIVCLSVHDWLFKPLVHLEEHDRIRLRLGRRVSAPWYGIEAAARFGPFEIPEAAEADSEAGQQAEEADEAAAEVDDRAEAEQPLDDPGLVKALTSGQQGDVQLLIEAGGLTLAQITQQRKGSAKAESVCRALRRLLPKLLGHGWNLEGGLDADPIYRIVRQPDKR